MLTAAPYAACSDDTTTSGTTTGQPTGQSSGDASGTAGVGSSTTGSGTTSGSNDTGNTGTADNGSTRTGGAANTQRLTDAEIASVSLTANSGEVQQNEIAVTRAQREDARSYAEDMVTMHTQAVDRQTALAQASNLQPADNPTTQQLKSDSDKTVAALNAASDEEFDDVYLRSQVDAHQKVLTLIDEKLLPSAQAQPLKDELNAMRETVADHLQRARDLVDADD